MAARGAAAWLGLALLAPLLAPAAAAAAQFTLLPQTLPQEVSRAAAVWDGRDRPSAGCPNGCAYLFGGTPGGRDVVRFNPQDGSVTKMQATLPTHLHLAAAFWSGTRAYVLGGGTDRIIAYDPVQDRVTQLDVRLPAPQYGAALAWTGTHAYLFGGMEDGKPSARIVRFDPAREAVEVSRTQLPQPRFAAAAGWDGTYAYVVGGLDGVGAPSDIYRYDPGRDEVTTNGVQAVRDGAYAAYASDGRYLYTLGGYRATTPASAEVLRFDMAGRVSEVLPERMPAPRVAAAAAWTGDRVLLFGGHDDQGKGTRDILTLAVPPGLPPTLTPTGTSTAAGPSPTGLASALPLGAVVAVVSLMAAAALAALVVLRVRRNRPAALAARPAPAAVRTPAAAALQVENLSVHEDDRTLVGPISFEVPAGSLTLVLGPSGAGKSSLLRAVAGLVPCRGRLQVQGRWLAPGAPSAKAAMGYVPQALQLHTNLTALANLAYFGAQFGLPAAEARSRGARLLEELGVEAAARRPLDKLSGGQQRRVSIAVALVHQPALVVLDEPTSGLDLASRKGLWMMLQQLARERGVAVLASSHFIDDTEYADRVAIVVDGKLAAAGSPRALVRSLPGEGKCVEVEFEALDAQARQRLAETVERLRAQGLVEWMEPRLFSARLFAKDPRQAARILPEVLHRAGFRVRSTRLEDIQMEDVFAHHAGRRPA